MSKIPDEYRSLIKMFCVFGLFVVGLCSGTENGYHNGYGVGFQYGKDYGFGERLKLEGKLDKAEREVQRLTDNALAEKAFRESR